jgi:hypothetical protein
VRATHAVAKGKSDTMKEMDEVDPYQSQASRAPRGEQHVD